MLFPGLHELHGLNHFLLEFFDVHGEFLSGFFFTHAPIIVVLRVYKRIIDVVHHKVENSNWVGGQFSVKDFLVVPSSRIQFLFVLGEIPHEPDRFIFDPLAVTVSHEKTRIDNALVVIRACIRCLVIDQDLGRAFSVQEHLNFLFVLFVLHEHVLE